MTIRIIAATTLILATFASAAISETRNSNWDKCPGGFDPGTNLCLSRDKFDHSFPLATSSSYSGTNVLLGNGSKDNPR